MSLPLEHLQLGDAAATVLEIAMRPSGYKIPPQTWRLLRGVFRQITDVLGLEVMLGRMGLAVSSINLRHLIAADETQHRHKPARLICIAIVRLHPDKVGLTRTSPEYLQLSSVAVSLTTAASPAAAAVATPAAAAAPLRAESSVFVPRPTTFPTVHIPSSCLGIITAALERATVRDLREIFRRFVVAGYVSRTQFGASYNIDSGNLYSWLKSDHSAGHGEIYSNIRDQLLALFSDSYEIPYPPPSVARDKPLAPRGFPVPPNEEPVKHVPDDVVARIRLTTRAMLNPTTETTAALQPEELQTMKLQQARFLEEAIADPPELVVLVDADHCQWSVVNLHRFTSAKVRFWLFVNACGYKRNIGVARHLTDNACVIVPMVMCKDTVDTVMSMHAGMLHAKMPANIPFICISADGFGYSCVETLRFWGRTCGLVRFPAETLCLYLMRFMPGLPWNAAARELSAVLQPMLADYYVTNGESVSCRDEFYARQKSPYLRDAVRNAFNNNELVLSDAAKALLQLEIV